MKCGLHQTYASGPAFVRPIHDHLHQLPPDAVVLYVGIDGERADACDDGALVKYIAPDDAASAFGHHTVEVSAGEHPRKEPDGRLRPGKIARKIVRRVDCRKGSGGNPPQTGLSSCRAGRTIRSDCVCEAIRWISCWCERV